VIAHHGAAECCGMVEINGSIWWKKARTGGPLCSMLFLSEAGMAMRGVLVSSIDDKGTIVMTCYDDGIAMVQQQ